MKLLRFLYLLLLLPLISLAEEKCPNYHVCFTPGHSCTELITTAINQAQSNIAMQAYSFTSFKIAEALVRAKQRGVDVKLILDKAWLVDKRLDERATAAIKFMYRQGIPLWIDYQPSIAHNKVIIIDHKRVITGSFNFTVAAEKYNAENVLLIDSEPLAEQYIKNWQSRIASSIALPPYSRESEFNLNQIKQQLAARPS